MRRGLLLRDRGVARTHEIALWGRACTGHR